MTTQETHKKEIEQNHDTQTRFWGKLGHGLVHFLNTYMAFFIVIAIGAYMWSYPDVWKDFFKSTEAGKPVALEIVLRAIIFFFAILYLTKLIKLFFSKVILKAAHIDSGIKDSFVTILGYIGFVVAVLVALSIMGVSFTSLGILVGALSVGVGFGLQNIVNNFISGIVILFERPLKAGDWVVVGGKEGIVKKINIRSTEIETFDKATVLMPNATILSSDLLNWTHHGVSGQITMALTLPGTVDTNAVRAVMLEAAAKEPNILKKPSPVFVFTDLGNNSLQFQLRCIVSNVLNRESIRSNLILLVLKGLQEVGIFPEPIAAETPKTPKAAKKAK